MRSIHPHKCQMTVWKPGLWGAAAARIAWVVIALGGARGCKQSKSNQIKTEQSRAEQNETAQCLAPPVRRDLRPVTQVRGHKGHGDPDIPDVQACSLVHQPHIVLPRASASHCTASCISLTLCCLVHQQSNQTTTDACVLCVAACHVLARLPSTALALALALALEHGGQRLHSQGLHPPRPGIMRIAVSPTCGCAPVRCMKCFFGSIGRRLKVFFAQCESS